MPISARWHSVLLPSMRGPTGAPSSIVFPAGCRICDQLLSDATRLPVWRQCLDAFVPVSLRSCGLCGLPATFDPEFPQAVSYCRDC